MAKTIVENPHSYDSLQWYMSNGYIGNCTLNLRFGDETYSPEQKRFLKELFKNEGARKLSKRMLTQVLENIFVDGFDLLEAEKNLNKVNKYSQISRNFPSVYHAFVQGVYSATRKFADVFGIDKEGRWSRLERIASENR